MENYSLTEEHNDLVDKKNRILIGCGLDTSDASYLKVPEPFKGRFWRIQNRIEEIQKEMIKGYLKSEG